MIISGISSGESGDPRRRPNALPSLYFQDLSLLCGNKCGINTRYKWKSFPWPFVRRPAFHISSLMSVTCLPCSWSLCCLRVLYRCVMTPLLQPIPLELVLMRSQEVVLHFAAQFQLPREMDDRKQAKGLPQVSLENRATRSPEWNSIRWCFGVGDGGVISLAGKQIERERKSEDKCQFSKRGLGIEGHRIWSSQGSMRQWFSNILGEISIWHWTGSWLKHLLRKETVFLSLLGATINLSSDNGPHLVVKNNA